MVIGTMPVFLAILANRRDRSAPWRTLALPLGLIGTGVAVVNVAALSAANATDTASIVLGLLASTAALTIWIVYGLVNAAIMRAPDAPGGLPWTGLQGIGATVGGLLLLPLTSFGSLDSVSASDLSRFVGWALVMGLVGSWLATWCWVVASRRLPLALASQLIVAETVFGLGYGFLFEERWPSSAEAIGATLQIAGVGAAMAMFSRPALPAQSIGKPMPKSDSCQ